MEKNFISLLLFQTGKFTFGEQDLLTLGGVQIGRRYVESEKWENHHFKRIIVKQFTSNHK